MFFYSTSAWKNIFLQFVIPEGQGFITLYPFRSIYSTDLCYVTLCATFCSIKFHYFHQSEQGFLTVDDHLAWFQIMDIAPHPLPWIALWHLWPWCTPAPYPGLRYDICDHGATQTEKCNHTCIDYYPLSHCKFLWQICKSYPLFPWQQVAIQLIIRDRQTEESDYSQYVVSILEKKMETNEKRVKQVINKIK